MIDDTQLVNKLLDGGAIDQTRLKEGIRLQDQNGGSLYETLVLGKLVEEIHAVRVVSEILNVEAIEVGSTRIGAAVVGLVPGSMATRNRVIPIELRDDALVLGMVDPIDVLAMDEIATHTGIDIHPVLVGPLDHRKAVAAHYGGDVKDEVFSSFDDFDVGGVMDDMMSDENWANFFDEAEEQDQVGEESMVISQDMRDRPSTDVLMISESEVEEIASISEVEFDEEFDGPIANRRSGEFDAALSDFEVDEAITNTRELEEGSEILSAQSAEDLFGKEETTGKAQVIPLAEREPVPALDVSSASLEDSGLLDTGSARTNVGMGVDHLKEGLAGGASKTTDSPDGSVETSRTELGVGMGDPKAPELAQDGSPDETVEAKRPKELIAKSRKSKAESDTDYGALGLAILKSGKGDEAKGPPPTPEAKGKRRQKPADPDPATDTTGTDATGADTGTGPSGTSEDSVITNVREGENEPADLPADALEVELEVEPLDGGVDGPDTSKVEVDAAADRKLRQAPKTDPATKELTPEDLFDLRNSEEAGLDERTTGAAAQIEKAAKAESALRHERETKRNAAVSKAAAAAATLPEIPAELSDRSLLLAALKLLSDQGALDLETLLALAKELND